MSENSEPPPNKEELEPALAYSKLSINVNPIIDDTTLRDGLQMPGTAVSPRHATHIAYLLDAIGIERIEVFHYQKPDQESIRLIRNLGLKSRLAA